MTFVIVMLAMLVFMYFLLIRPQKAKQRAAQDMLNRLAPGDEIVTVGGIYADVVEVDDQKVVLEIAEDVHIEVARRAIASIVPPETETEDDEDDEEDEDEGLEADADGGAGPEDGEAADGQDTTVDGEAGDAAVEAGERTR
ncbi:MAG: preprotein translocase subunit YajC [Thermoleophilia bacterium]|nr:preprotein translocase subunit YajC [Thermoleophilia bacterium]